VIVQASRAVHDLRTLVADSARELAASGLVLGTAGNVSARLDDRVAVTATGLNLADTTPDHVVVVDLDGNLVDGDLAPTSEVDLHLGIYARHGAGAVVHAHAPMATALSCVLDVVPCVHYAMLALGGDVPVAPYRTFGTPELAQDVVDALEGHTAALMASHGAVTCGHDLAAAMHAMELLEWACGVYWHAAQVGTPHVMDAAERQAVVDAVVARGYGATREARS
jgi:L-fuculose-phosphate aldolase